MSRPPKKLDKLPGVSILKPLKGIDDNLIENLSTFFDIDYPNYEIIFCVQDANDPAIEVVRKLLIRFPSIDASLFYGRFFDSTLGLILLFIFLI